MQRSPLLRLALLQGASIMYPSLDPGLRLRGGAAWSSVMLADRPRCVPRVLSTRFHGSYNLWCWGAPRQAERFPMVGAHRQPCRDKGGAAPATALSPAKPLVPRRASLLGPQSGFVLHQRAKAALDGWEVSFYLPDRSRLRCTGLCLIVHDPPLRGEGG